MATSSSPQSSPQPFVYLVGSVNGCPEITYPVAIATPTTLPAALMVFAAWHRGHVHRSSSVGRSVAPSSIRTFACPAQRTHLVAIGFASLMSISAVYSYHFRLYAARSVAPPANTILI